MKTRKEIYKEFEEYKSKHTLGELYKFAFERKIPMAYCPTCSEHFAFEHQCMENWYKGELENNFYFTTPTTSTKSSPQEHE